MTPPRPVHIAHVRRGAADVEPLCGSRLPLELEPPIVTIEPALSSCPLCLLEIGKQMLDAEERS